MDGDVGTHIRERLSVGSDASGEPHLCSVGATLFERMVVTVLTRLEA